MWITANADHNGFWFYLPESLLPSAACTSSAFRNSFSGQIIVMFAQISQCNKWYVSKDKLFSPLYNVVENVLNAKPFIVDQQSHVCQSSDNIQVCWGLFVNGT